MIFRGAPIRSKEFPGFTVREARLKVTERMDQLIIDLRRLILADNPSHDRQPDRRAGVAVTNEIVT